MAERLDCITGAFGFTGRFIARQRKRREFDPVAGAALAALADLAKGASAEEAARIQEIEEYLTALDRVGREVLEDEKAALAVIELLRRSFGRPKE